MSRFVAIEFSADASDNRPLGVSGAFLTGQYSDRDIAAFPTIDAALHAAGQAPNRRDGCTLEAIGQSRRAAA